MNYLSKFKTFICINLLSSLFITNLEAATVALANAPLTRSPSAVVKPNILFVLDDSGSMTWTFLPDRVGYDSVAANGTGLGNGFRGSYGYLSAQCNGVYYDPTQTYKPPVTSAAPVNDVPTRFSDAVFTAASDDGFNPTAATRNLDNNFTANRFTPENANNTNQYSTFGSYINSPIGPFGAVYYIYNGTTTNKDYNNITSAFYSECDTAISDRLVGNVGYQGDSSPLFTKRRLSTTMTTTITISDPDSNTNATTVSNITVNGVSIWSGTSVTESDIATLASGISTRISANGYTANAAGGVVTITGPANAANLYPIITSNGGLRLSADIFPDTINAARLTNFANWYSYYRTRLLAMKSSAGEAFSQLDEKYRIGFMTINQSAPSFGNADFTGQNRTDWYSQLYNATYDTSGTPLRVALSTAGRYYAKKLSGIADPVQYSCQQNFTLLSTDGYWNNGAGVQLDGSTTVGNQDGSANRPQYDGSTEKPYTAFYTRKKYSTSTSGCGKKQSKLITQNQKGNCTVATNNLSDNCTPETWKDDGLSESKCVSNIKVPNPNPSAPEYIERKLNPASGQSDTLADVAQYYYQTDLRTTALNNCTGGARADNSTGDVCTNDVSTSDRDNQSVQHMNTFTLSLGNEGFMKFIPNYEEADGDFAAIRDADEASATKCTWQTAGTVCNWPSGMANGQPQNIDDTWHAAVNGRGTYFSASDPQSLATGISQALIGIGKRRGSAAAASSSSLNPVQNDNAAFVASFVNVDWTGNLESRPIDTVNATTSRTATWCAEDVRADACATAIIANTTNNSTKYYCETPQSNACADGGGTNGLSYTGNGNTVCRTEVAQACTGTFTTRRKDNSLTSPMVSATSDNRTIKTPVLNTTTGKLELTDFNAAFATANPSYFNATKLAQLSQWSDLSTSQQAAAVANVLGYLRGQYGYDKNPENVVTTAVTTGSVTTNVTTDNRLFRERKTILGDVLESKPTFAGKSLFQYGYPGYEAFKTTKNANTAVQKGTVFVGANDGMLHAFAADTGIERWAYVPSMVLPNLWKLADENYSADGEHRNFINGSPAVADVCTQSCDSTSAVWKTILVIGLNGGGRGYAALDVTDPTSPSVLWEFTSTAGNGSVKDADLGFSFARPVVARKANGTWTVIVSSGYNNVSSGDGKGYLYVLNAGTGEIISKISTNEGDTTTPSGLAKISAWNNDSNGNLAQHVYGGDLLGNVWKFDISATTTASIGTGSAFKLTKLYSDNAGTVSQPITTTPLLGAIGSTRVVFVGTGKYLEGLDVTATPTTQSVYAIKDDGGTVTLNNPRASTTMVRQTITNSTNLNQRTVSSPAVVDWNTGRGWFADLPDSGERVNVDGVLIQGVVSYPSIVPTSSACKPSGTGWLNYFDYATGSSIQGSVSEKFNVPIVGIGVLSIGGDSFINVVDADGNVRPGGPKVTGKAGAFTGKRTQWRELLD